jgi:hypothetical protein
MSAGERLFVVPSAGGKSPQTLVDLDCAGWSPGVTDSLVALGRMSGTRYDAPPSRWGISQELQDWSG